MGDEILVTYFTQRASGGHTTDNASSSESGS